ISYSADFQEHLLTSLLLFCEKAQFIQLPTEQAQVPQELKRCNQNIQSHFSSKPLLYFTFLPPQVPLVLQFLEHLDRLAEQFAISESSQFYSYLPNSKKINPDPHSSTKSTQTETTASTEHEPNSTIYQFPPAKVSS